MFANEDIYTGKTEPAATINPKIIGAFYINTSNATIYICIDNTLNKNKWVRSGYTLDEIWDFINPKLPKPQDMPFGDTYIISNTIYSFNIKYKNTTNYPIMLHLRGPGISAIDSDIFPIKLHQWDPSGKEYIVVGNGAGVSTNMSVIEWIILPNYSFAAITSFEHFGAKITALRRR